jgi:hypothetical protein
MPAMRRLKTDAQHGLEKDGKQALGAKLKMMIIQIPIQLELGYSEPPPVSKNVTGRIEDGHIHCHRNRGNGIEPHFFV